MIFYNQYSITKTKGAFNRPIYQFNWPSGRVLCNCISLSRALNEMKRYTNNKNRRGERK